MNFDFLTQLSDRRKKILFGFGLLIVVIIVGLGYYFIFFAPAPEPEEAMLNVNGQMIPVSQLPDILNLNFQPIETNINAGQALPDVSAVADGGKTLVEQLGSADVTDIALSPAGQEVIYYDATDGKFYQIDSQGNLIALTEDEYPNVETVTWGSQKDKAVLEFPDGSNIYYNFSEDQQYSLPEEMEDFSFSSADDSIGFKYIAIDEEDQWLGVSTPEGNQVRGLEQLGENQDKVNVDWSPSGQAVATFYDFIDGDRQQVGLVGLKGENFKGMIVEGKDFESQWSLDGQKLLYSAFRADSDYKPSLWIVDAYGDDIGKNRKELQINTWVEKCTFSGSSSVYCAVPEELPRGAGFSKDSAKETTDNIYKIDLETGQKTLIAVPSDSQGVNSYSIENLLISEDEETLYFKDVNTQKLNKIKLK